jgi:hypothetical protein
MSRAQRLGLIGLAVAVAVVAFVVLRPEAKEAASPAPPPGAQPANGHAADGSPQREKEAGGPERPGYQEVRVEGGRAVGGVKTISVNRGEVVRLSVRSDTAEEVHVHGYDLSKKVTAGRPARFRFPAEIQGVFEIELERAHEQIASLKVQP